MPFKSFKDFDYLEGRNLVSDDYIVGYREFNKEFRTKISDLTIELLKNIDLQVAPEVLYVSPAGRDTNSGRSEFTPFRTIKKACAKALEISRNGADTSVEQLLGNALNNGTPVWGPGSRPVTIFVKTGRYVEDNPIYVPPSCTLYGDSLRTTTIIPKNRFYDILWVNNRCYVWGFTFRDHLSPSYAIAYPEFKRIDGSLLPSYPGTRVTAATARAESFFNNTLEGGRGRFPATLTVSPDEDNLSLDTGDPIFDPARIAFLRRYFLGLANFFDEVEFIQGDDFETTLYYDEQLRRPFTVTSPYPQGCSSITQASLPGRDDAGGGVLVDGDKVDGPLRSMVMDSFTQFNEGGKGIHITNNGYAQLVSTFTICCTEGILCENGGTCSINTSNCSFGLSGLVSRGKSPKPSLIGTLRFPIQNLGDIIEVERLGAFSNEQEYPFDFQPYPGQVFRIEWSSQAGPVTATNSESYFNILSASKIEPYQESGNTFFRCRMVLDVNYSPSLDTSLQPLGINSIPEGVGTRVNFFIRSTITASAHTLEYIGTGTTLLSAVPQKGGQTDVATEAVFDEVGRVFFTSTNQFGDFRIGRDLTIVQATGTIEGETFERSILQTITPFTIAIASE